MKLRASNFVNMLLLSSVIHGGLGFFMLVPGADDKSQKREPVRVQITSFDSIALENTAPSIVKEELLDLSPSPQPRMQPVEKKKTVEQPEHLAMLIPESLPDRPEAPRPKKEESQVREVQEPAPEPEVTERIEQAAQSTQSLPVNAPVQDDALAATYENIVVAWLERSKRYPDRAIRRGIEGEVLLTLRISKTGELLTSSVDDSSGFSILDEEVKRMVQRASPFPPIPEHFSSSEISFSVPIAFRLE